MGLIVQLLLKISLEYYNDYTTVREGGGGWLWTSIAYVQSGTCTRDVFLGDTPGSPPYLKTVATLLVLALTLMRYTRSGSFYVKDRLVF